MSGLIQNVSLSPWPLPKSNYSEKHKNRRWCPLPWTTNNRFKRFKGLRTRSCFCVQKKVLKKDFFFAKWPVVLLQWSVRRGCRVAPPSVQCPALGLGEGSSRSQGWVLREAKGQVRLPLLLLLLQRPVKIMRWHLTSLSTELPSMELDTFLIAISSQKEGMRIWYFFPRLFSQNCCEWNVGENHTHTQTHTHTHKQETTHTDARERWKKRAHAHTCTHIQDTKAQTHMHAHK